MFHMNIRTAMLAGSTGLVKEGGLHQDLGGAGSLGEYETSGDDLAKGGSLWED